MKTKKPTNRPRIEEQKHYKNTMEKTEKRFVFKSECPACTRIGIYALFPFAPMYAYPWFRSSLQTSLGMTHDVNVAP